MDPSDTVADRVTAARTAAGNQRQLDELRRLHAAVIDACDKLPYGFVVVDQTGRVLIINEQARRTVTQADAIFVNRGRLRATLASEDGAFQALLQNATAKPRRKGANASVRAILSRTSGKRPLHVLVTALNGRAPFTDSPCLAVFITDPHTRSAPSAEVLRACFGFSPGEARVVQALVLGRNVKEIAGALSLTENTVRAYVKAILTKSGCRSQSALIGMLLRSVAAIRVSEAEDA